MLTMSSEGLVHIFDARNPQAGLSTRLNLQVGDGQWNCCNSGQFAVAAESGQILLMDARNLAAPLLAFPGHEKQASALDFSEKHVLASCGFDGLVKVWDCLSGKQLAQQNAKSGRLFSLACYQDNRKILTCGNEKGELYVWDLEENAVLAERLSRE